MNLSSQIKKLRTIYSALEDPNDYVMRVIPDNLNSPFLSVGDLVAFDNTSVPLKKTTQDQIYLFIFDDFEYIGTIENEVIQSLKSTLDDFNVSKLESIHKLRFLSK